MTPTSSATMRRYDHAAIADTAAYRRLVHALGAYLETVRYEPDLNRALFAVFELGHGTLMIDSCERCVDHPTVPFKVQISDDGATGTYRCRVCDHLWRCTFPVSFHAPTAEAA